MSDCALAVAAWNGDLEIVRQLVATGAYLEARNSDGITPLMFAAQEAHPSVVAFLMESGAQVNARNNQRETALLFAGRGENSHVIEDLLKSLDDTAYQADVATIEKLEAVSEGLCDVVRLLLAAGADANAADVYGHSPLINFASYGHLGVVKLLLEAEVDVRAETVDGETALTGARAMGNGGVVELIARRLGADGS